METYANILLIAIPGFLGLMLLEIGYGYWKKNQTYTFMDTLSSLSSGMTNLIKDVMGIGIIVISYPFIKSQLAMITLEETAWLYFIAFVCIDFASYWNHRLNHGINVFWNRHVIHHSSEEFNLACALRQSISNLIGFGALFLLPAALLGVPQNIITVLAPLHLFGQFWYHTRHIKKLGWLEYIIVTPSQHRVHHAINPEYIDKNLGAIFSVWDRLFGTFQEELDDVPCVYGTLKPVNTWNPILINFQHNWGLFHDAWHTKNKWDKIRLWFMPTGWRPKDVAEKNKRPSVNDVFKRQKYQLDYTPFQRYFAFFHFLIINVLLFVFLSQIGDLNTQELGIFSFWIFISIFGFTALMDGFHWAPYFELLRSSFGIVQLFFPMFYSIWQTAPVFISVLLFSLVLQFIGTLYLMQNQALIRPKLMHE